LSVSVSEVVQQSRNALAQWGPQWKIHAKAHAEIRKLPFIDLMNIGVGRSIVLCANGFSLEQNIDLLKEYRDSIDIMCCDKSLSSLINHGITPDYCMVCDANVSYEDYLKPYEDSLSEITLLMNVCADPVWSIDKPWKKTYYFVNKDSIRSEATFSPLSKCKNLIPAGTNVSNAMVVMATQSDDKGRRNFFGYDKIILLGFDYCWTPEGNYYAFDHDGEGKRYYMKHICCLDNKRKYVYTSQNLMFSARWGSTYIQNYKLPIVNCSDHTLLGGCVRKTLRSQLGYSYKEKDRVKVLKLTRKLSRYHSELVTIQKELGDIAKDHWSNFSQSI